MKTLETADYNELWAELRKRYGVLRIAWCLDDIKNEAEQMGEDLTDEELEEVAKTLEDSDAYVGVDWDTIKIVIQTVLDSRPEQTEIDED